MRDTHQTTLQQMSHRLGSPVMVGQFHEWQTAVGLVLLRIRKIPVGMDAFCTIFTVLVGCGESGDPSGYGCVLHSFYVLVG